MSPVNSFGVALLLTASVLAQSGTPLTISNDDLTASTTAAPTATPTGPVVTVTFPGDAANGQVLVGSLIGTASQLTTLAVGCPEGTSDDDCGFVGDLTVTAGSGTLALTIPYDQDNTVTEDCNFSSAGGVCTIIGPGTNENSSDTATVIVTSTTSFGTDFLTSAGIIITAGDTAGLNLPASTGVPSSSTTRGAGNASGGSSSSSRSGPTTTSTMNEARALVPGSVGAFLLGVVAVWL